MPVSNMTQQTPRPSVRTQSGYNFSSKIPRNLVYFPPYDVDETTQVLRDKMATQRTMTNSHTHNTPTNEQQTRHGTSHQTPTTHTTQPSTQIQITSCICHTHRASRIISTFAFDTVQLPCWIVSTFHSLSTAAFASRIFLAWVSEKCLCPKYNDPSNSILCLRCDFHDLHDLSVEMIPYVVSWIHEFPQCTHAVFFGGRGEEGGEGDSSLSLTGSPQASSASLLPFCKVLPPPLELPTFSLLF